MPAFSFEVPPAGLTTHLQRLAQRSPTALRQRRKTRRFGTQLESHLIFGAESLDQ